MEATINIKDEKNIFEDKDIGYIYEVSPIRIPVIYFKNTYKKEGKKYKRFYVGINTPNDSLRNKEFYLMLKILNCDWKDSIFKFRFPYVDSSKFYQILVPIEYINSNTFSFSYSFEDSNSNLYGHGSICINLYNLCKKVDNKFILYNHAIYYNPCRLYFQSIGINEIEIIQENINSNSYLNGKLNIQIKKSDPSNLEIYGMKAVLGLYLNNAYLNNSEIVSATFIDWNKTNTYKLKALKFNIENYLNNIKIEIVNKTEFNKETLQVEENEYGEKGIFINPYIDANIEIKIILLIDDVEFEWIIKHKENNKIDNCYFSQTDENHELKTKFIMEWEKEWNEKFENETYEKLIRFINQIQEKID